MFGLFPCACCVLSGTDVHDFPVGLDEGSFVLAFPLYAAVNALFRDPVDGFPVLDGSVRVENVCCGVVGMVNHGVRIQIVEMVLDVG